MNYSQKKHKIEQFGDSKFRKNVSMKRNIDFMPKKYKCVGWISVGNHVFTIKRPRSYIAIESSEVKIGTLFCL